MSFFLFGLEYILFFNHAIVSYWCVIIVLFYSSAVLQYGFLMVRRLIKHWIKKNRKHPLIITLCLFYIPAEFVQLILAKLVFYSNTVL